MYSCAQACKIRSLGVNESSCRQQCQRTGQSGCSPTVNGFKFDLCRECIPERINREDGCSRWPTVDECSEGCSNYPGDVSIATISPGDYYDEETEEYYN